MMFAFYHASSIWNGLSPLRPQAITWTNADLILIELLGTNFSEIKIKIRHFSFMKMPWKMTFAKCRQFCLGLYVFSSTRGTKFYNSAFGHDQEDSRHSRNWKWDRSLHGRAESPYDDFGIRWPGLLCNTFPFQYSVRKAYGLDKTRILFYVTAKYSDAYSYLLKNEC